MPRLLLRKLPHKSLGHPKVFIKIKGHRYLGQILPVLTIHLSNDLIFFHVLLWDSGGSLPPRNSGPMPSSVPTLSWSLRNFSKHILPFKIIFYCFIYLFNYFTIFHEILIFIIFLLFHYFHYFSWYSSRSWKLGIPLLAYPFSHHIFPFCHFHPYYYSPLATLQVYTAI